MSNQNANQLLAFKKGIEREVSQYTNLKDEKYFEAEKIFWSQLQHMDVKEYWNQTTCLVMMMITKNYSNKTLLYV